MASVSSLDQDMRRLRMDRYTPQAANEVKSWIENTLGEKLQSDDLLECLKDGTLLCRLANLILPAPGIKFKTSSMPFTQRENISHFLTACESAPLYLPAHDRFLTVDLYDEKDPAQVVQCIGAFSRAANAVNPTKVPTSIGPKRAPSPSKRAAHDTSGGNIGNFARVGGLNNTVGGSFATQNAQRATSPGIQTNLASTSVSSWSKKSDEVSTAPAWNINLYGYMGGASQGNQGISFGTRRQITAPPVGVPSFAEKEKRREELEEEAEQQRAAEAEAERRRIEAENARKLEEQERREAEEWQARAEEEARWEAEAQKERERERQELAEERRRIEVERKRLDEAEEEARRQALQAENERRRQREEQEQKQAHHDTSLTHRQLSIQKSGDSSLRGQYLSEYQAEQRGVSESPRAAVSEARSSESERIRELERQLEEARERERLYTLERQSRASIETDRESVASNTYRRPKTVASTSQTNPQTDDESWDSSEIEFTSTRPQPSTPSLQKSTRPLPISGLSSSSPFSRNSPFQRRAKPLDPPQMQPRSPSPPSVTAEPSEKNAIKEPDARSEAVDSVGTRTDRFLATNPAPAISKPTSHFPSEMGFTSTSERAAEDARRIASQTSTKAGGWASKSLLEREMERERERQREWEEAQLAKSKATFGNSKGLIGPRELTKK